MGKRFTKRKKSKNLNKKKTWRPVWRQFRQNFDMVEVRGGGGEGLCIHPKRLTVKINEGSERYCDDLDLDYSTRKKGRVRPERATKECKIM